MNEDHHSIPIQGYHQLLRGAFREDFERIQRTGMRDERDYTLTVAALEDAVAILPIERADRLSYTRNVMRLAAMGYRLKHLRRSEHRKRQVLQEIQSALGLDAAATAYGGMLENRLRVLPNRYHSGEQQDDDWTPIEGHFMLTSKELGLAGKQCPPQDGMLDYFIGSKFLEEKLTSREVVVMNTPYNFCLDSLVRWEFLGDKPTYSEFVALNTHCNFCLDCSEWVLDNRRLGSAFAVDVLGEKQVKDLIRRVAVHRRERFR